MRRPDQFRPLNEIEGRSRGRFVDAPGLRQEISFRVRRTGSRYGISPNQQAKLRSLGVSRRSRKPETHSLVPSMAGQLEGVQQLLDTELVLPNGNTLATEPYEIIRIAKDEPTVKPSTYEVDGQAAVSLDWSTGEHSRIEQYSNFTLFAWTTRLSATDAIRLFKSSAEDGAKLYVLTAGAELVCEEADELDRSYVESRADRVRLLRLENPRAATLLWEVHEAGGAAWADFVVMARDAAMDQIGDWIERTGETRIWLAEGEILRLARELGAV